MAGSVTDADWQKLKETWFTQNSNYSPEELESRFNKVRYAYERGTKEQRDHIARVIDTRKREGWNPAVGDQLGFASLAGGGLAIAGQVDDRDVEAWQKEMADKAAGGSAEEKKKAAEDAQRASLTERISAYVRAMQGDPSPDDPVMKGLAAQGADAGQQAYGGWGAGGGGLGRLSNVAAQRLSLPYLQQRQQNALQGMQLLNQRDIGLGQLQQGANEMDLRRQQMQYGMAQGNFGAAQNNGGTAGSIVGGMLGAIPGIALAPLTGGASLGLIGAGAGIGSGVGKSTAQWGGGRGWGGSGYGSGGYGGGGY